MNGAILQKSKITILKIWKWVWSGPIYFRCWKWLCNWKFVRTAGALLLKNPWQNGWRRTNRKYRFWKWEYTVAESNSYIIIYFSNKKLFLRLVCKFIVYWIFPRCAPSSLKQNNEHNGTNFTEHCDFEDGTCCNLLATMNLGKCWLWVLWLNMIEYDSSLCQSLDGFNFPIVVHSTIS